jgi:hypothetical protein
MMRDRTQLSSEHHQTSCYSFRKHRMSGPNYARVWNIYEMLTPKPKVRPTHPFSPHFRISLWKYDIGNSII